MAKDNEGYEGVWRTIRGRRVFIRTGEELGSAMARSGKFKNLKREDVVKGKQELENRRLHAQTRDMRNAYDNNRYKFGDSYWSKQINQAREWEVEGKELLDNYYDNPQEAVDTSDLQGRHIEGYSKYLRQRNHEIPKELEAGTYTGGKEIKEISLDQKLENYYKMDRVLRAMNNENALNDNWLMNYVADGDTDNYDIDAFKKEYGGSFENSGDGFSTTYDEAYNAYKKSLGLYDENEGEKIYQGGVLTRDWFKDAHITNNGRAGATDDELRFLQKDFPDTPVLAGRGKKYNSIQEYFDSERSSLDVDYQKENNEFVKSNYEKLQPDSDEYTNSLNKYMTEHGELGGKQGNFYVYNSDENDFYKAKLEHDKQYLADRKEDTTEKWSDKDKYEYDLYKKAKENPDSIDPMTENSTDWEELDKKWSNRYDYDKEQEEFEKESKTFSLRTDTAFGSNDLGEWKGKTIEEAKENFLKENPSYANGKYGHITGKEKDTIERFKERKGKQSEDFSKVNEKAEISFGKIDAYGNGRKSNEATIEMSLKDGVFSASGNIWNSKHTDIISGGQNLDEMKEYFKGNKDFETIHSMWKKYHLNDMHAGTEKQEKALEKKFGGVNANKYSEQVEYLKSIGLYEDEGYKYGTGWLKRDIPEADLKTIVALIRKYNK